MSNLGPKKGSAAKICLKCHKDLNKSSSRAGGLCHCCSAGSGKEQKNQKGKRDSHTFGNANEVMEVEATYSDFISCDRAGRRNAVHDIQGDASTISMRKLAGNISELSIEGSENQAGATSSEKEPGTRPEGRDGSTSS
ncbi:PREDICTED: cAMP-dependent protein kinase inhibitor gamma isoform X1 [Gavialis gangeticus]|uniref:cAMP-dependent protein kinase inhibitor gamma isoform X1 n=2 Tax=Gavialis gangeticus TaxID=94835 RepID=UPI00092E33DD|nr:PREDICTED: cAMP-dependent protein kinase inhibitor gamma isoform X1 [Gavialis gangeticus]